MKSENRIFKKQYKGMEKLEYRNTQSSLSIISILIENISIIFHVSVYFINTEISFSKKYYDPPLRSNNSKKFFNIFKISFPSSLASYIILPHFTHELFHFNYAKTKNHWSNKIHGIETNQSKSKSHS